MGQEVLNYVNIFDAFLLCFFHSSEKEETELVYDNYFQLI